LLLPVCAQERLRLLGIAVPVWLEELALLDLERQAGAEAGSHSGASATACSRGARPAAAARCAAAWARSVQSGRKAFAR
jgi:hypothetical protein